jgi:sugar/nucleoside kinase (ribokinase family)
VLGGSAAIVACGLARLGVPTALVATIGDDAFGRSVLADLETAGVDTGLIEVRVGGRTGLTVILSGPDDRSMLTLPGVMTELDISAVRDAVVRSAPDRVHVASMFLIPALGAALPGLLREWRAAGICTSVDTNWDPAEAWAGVDAAFGVLDVFLPNRAELTAVAGVVAPRAGSDPGAAAAALAELGTRIVVKDGADGGWSLDSTGKRAAASGLKVEVVDTTGAGDSFDAGYLAAIAHGIKDEGERLRWATAAGSLSTRAAGGTGGQPTLDELRAAVASVRPSP